MDAEVIAANDVFKLDYPVDAPPDVQPIMFRAQIIQYMRLLYLQSVPCLSEIEAHNAAVATWETDWDSDPVPRTLDLARHPVYDDLQYWEEE